MDENSEVAVIIPSFGRSDSINKIIEAINDYDIFVFVKPQEFESYDKNTNKSIGRIAVITDPEFLTIGKLLNKIREIQFAKYFIIVNDNCKIGDEDIKELIEKYKKYSDICGAMATYQQIDDYKHFNAFEVFPIKQASGVFIFSKEMFDLVEGFDDRLNEEAIIDFQFRIRKSDFSLCSFRYSEHKNLKNIQPQIIDAKNIESDYEIMLEKYPRCMRLILGQSLKIEYDYFRLTAYLGNGKFFPGSTYYHWYELVGDFNRE